MSNVAQELFEFHFDLPSLACHAAIELDNLLRGKSTGLNFVMQLAEVISQEMALSSGDTASIISLGHLNPATAVALNYAFADSELSSSKTKISELIGEIRQIVQCLRRVVENPEKALTEEPTKVEQLKSFCLALSKRALAIETPQYQDETQHPYRR